MCSEMCCLAALSRQKLINIFSVRAQSQTHLDINMSIESERNDLSTVEKSNVISHEGNNKWLDAHNDPVANLYTFSSCMAFSDISGDGEAKLVIADLGTGTFDMKLKVYKGTTLISENAIIDLPTGVCTFYMDNNEPRVPAIGVASGPYLYVYKNLRPYFKFTLPPLDVNPVEQDLWNQAREDKIDVTVLREMLDSIRREGNEGALTVRSLRFLMLQDREQMEAFANVHKVGQLKRQTVITCLDTLNKSTSEDDAISCLVVGTESKEIYVLDPEAFTILTKMAVPSVPVFLSVSGLYDVEFRIVMSCRNGNIYTLKRGMKMAKLCFELNSQPVGLQRVGKNIIVGCMDQTLQCYSTKGKKMWTVYLPAAITTMDLMDHRQKGFKAVMVALRNGEVHIYRDKFLINSIKTADIITGLKFGRFGREDSTLVMSTKRGGLMVKILKRNAAFEDKDVVRGPPAAQHQKLNVPKKTKVFVDQTMREREHGVSMHRMFQHDLYRLRLTTARAFVKALDSSLTPVSTNPNEPIKLAAQIQGIGPTFKLTVSLQNTSLSKPSMSLLISFLYDEKLYSLQKTMIPVPLLVPGLNYTFETLVECMSDKGIADVIKVFVVKEGRSAPIITAVINMPHDLYRLRLTTARAFVKALDSSLTPVSTNPNEPIKLAAQIQGIGPTFKLTVSLQNTSLTKPSMSLLISFLYDEKLYSLQKTMIPVPLLVPGLNYTFETLVECMSDKGIADVIKVFVVKEGRSAPIITAVINMPVSETMVVV